MTKADFIFYYLAPIWDGRKEEKALGGTYLSLINLTRELAKQGFEVIVFSDCGNKIITTQEKLTYIPVSQFDYDAYSADIFVSGRIMKMEWDRIQAHTKILWSHDNEVTDPMVELEKGLSLIVVESIFHKKILLQQHPDFPEGQMLIFYSPIDVDSYPAPNQIEKKFAKGIYFSHPGRGLENLLEMVPQIKQAIPEFHAIILSSWLPYSYFTEHESDKKMEHLLNKLLNTNAVTWKRSIAQPQLKKILASCYFHLYPTEFDEIFCYSALQACMSGVPPITTNTGVFPEWDALSDAFFIVDIAQENWKDKFVEIVKMACTDSELYRKKAVNARKFVIEHLRADKVAYQWIKLLSTE